MKFRYKKLAPNVIRPIIPIEIIYNGIEVTYEVLVDSGADQNIFHSGLTEILGIDIRSGKKDIIYGVTGVGENQYIHNVDLKVGGHLFKDITVGFLEKMGGYSYGIVGQNGFFNLFKVTFDKEKEEVELKLNDKNYN